MSRRTGICHCRSCRRETGGALIAAFGFAREAVVIGGTPFRHFYSSADVQRSFCAECGTSISYASRRWPDGIHLIQAQRQLTFAARYLWCF